MKLINTTSGPFTKRLYIEYEEMDILCSNALQSVELLPNSPQPIRIERFIEKSVGITPEYVDLGPHVLGFSRFGPKGAEAVSISTRIDADGSKPAERRLNATLAHEAGHCLLHAPFFKDGSVTA